MAQPEIPGTDIGKVVIPFGSDGSDWIALLVSGLGALQVELASLPTGAVTIADGADVTLGALADALVAAGATGSVSAKLRRLTTDLDALLTELKLKADLTETQPIIRTVGGLTVIRHDESGLVRTGVAEIYWITLVSVSSSIGTLIVWDNTSASGTIKWHASVQADGTIHAVFDPPIECGTGIYFSMGNGTSPAATIGYLPA